MTQTQYIEPCKPPVGYYHYSNPESQGALMAQTAKWPRKMSMHRSALDPFRDPVDEPVYERVPVPTGLQILSAYLDRMQDWDWDKCARAIKELPDGGFKRATDEQLLSFCRTYWPEHDIVAVRVIYCYNVATGYDCPAIQALYRETAKETEP